MKKILIWLFLVGMIGCAGGKTVIRSEPPTAFVVINGAAEGVTPLEIKLACDETRKFQVEVSSPGYLTETKTIKCRRLLGPKKAVLFVLKPGEEPQKPGVMPSQVSQKEFATIKIKSIPDKAEVYINKKLIGTTPIRRQKLRSGRYRLEVRKAGFKPWRENIQIDPGAEQEYYPILEEE